MSGLNRAKGLLNSAIQAAEDYELRSDDGSRHEQHQIEGVPSLNTFVAQEVSRWPRIVRVSALVVVVAAIAIFLFWKSLPDDLKRELVFRRPAHIVSDPSPLINTPPTWVYPNAPIMGLSNQVVLSIRSASNENETAQFHLSVEAESRWHDLKVGQQYHFRLHGRDYALTLLQVVQPGARVEADAVLIAPLSTATQ